MPIHGQHVRDVADAIPEHDPQPEVQIGDLGHARIEQADSG
jgi:hypothetical protein